MLSIVAPQQGGVTGVVVVRGGDVGPHPEDGAGPGQLSAQGCAEDHWEATSETDGWELRLPASVGGNGGSEL